MMRSTSLKSAFVRFLLLAVLVLVNLHFAKAQNLASISGRVQDASGAAIPDTSVTVTSAETATTRTATSDEQGDYRVLSLPVGAYEIKAEKTGFKTRVQSGLQLTVGQTAVVNMIMEVGQVQQQVTVTADVPVVNTSTVSTSGLVEEQQIKDLPLNGRSFDLLITLNAGAANYTSNKTAGAGALLGNLFTISGRQYFQNLFLLNGVTYPGPNQTHSVPGNVSGQMLGIDAIREFNVQSNAYDAQYGQRSGGQINIVSMSGTNALHGSIFEFIRNSALDARNHFDHPFGERIPPFKRNQFGGALGGPIKKDKTFLFGNYEGFRQILGVSDAPFVPSDNARVGLLDPSPVNGVCATGTTMYPSFNGAILPYMDAFYPAPGPGSICYGSGTAQGFYNPPEHIREDFGIVRLDENFSNKDSLSLSDLFDDGVSSVPALDPNFATHTVLRAQVFTAQETHIFSPSLINVVTFGYSLNHWHYTNPALVPIPASLDLVAGRLIGRFGIGGTGGASSGTISSGGGGKGIDSETHTSRTTYADTISWSKGRHQLMAGVWLMRLYSRELTPVESGGFASWTGLPQLETGFVNQFGVAPLITPMHWRQMDGAWFAQDIIQVTPKFTLRLGLRHEFTDGWHSTNGTGTSYQYVNGVIQTAPLVGNTPFPDNNSKWLFGPRVGIAYDPFGKGKTSIRAGFGIHFDLQDTLGTALNSNAPFNGIITYSVPTLWTSIVPPGGILPATTESPSCAPGVLQPCAFYAAAGAPPNFKTPTVDEWNLSIEQALTPNTSITIGYVGSHMVHGPMEISPNEIPPQVCAVTSCLAGGTNGATKQYIVPQGALYIPTGPGGAPNTMPNPFVANGGTYLTFENNDSYNALEVGFKHRFSYGLQYQINYTWSKDEDFLSGWSADDANDNGTTLNAFNPKLDWGPSSTDKRHKISANAAYQLPFGQGKHFAGNSSGALNKLVSGWQLNAIFTATSGFGFDNNIGSNISGDGDISSPDRPYWNPYFTGPVVTGNPGQWFNPNAFTLCPGAPAPATPNGPQICTASTSSCSLAAPTSCGNIAYGTYGNVGRNVLTGPNLIELDMSLFKKTQITERVSAEFRFEGFNILNRSNYATPGLSDFSGTSPSATAGAISTTATSSRQLQFGLKLLF
jgi:hypothetical protein